MALALGASLFASQTHAQTTYWLRRPVDIVYEPVGEILFRGQDPGGAAPQDAPPTGEDTAATGQDAPTAPSTADEQANPFDSASPTGSGFGWLSNVFNSSTQALVDVSSTSASGDVSAAFLQLSRDAATLFQSVPGVQVEMRAMGHHELQLQGRRLGQSNGEGSYWFPARQDLDTLLSKIDSRLIDNVVAIKGPYSALYGPGLSFYDVNLLDTPRFEGPFESHGYTSLDYETNGEQWHGRQACWGGSTDWGYRVGYGHRTGNDYDTGADVQLPASYNSRIVDVALGGNLTGSDNLEIHTFRLDQTGVEFPGQWFDINFLVTDAYGFEYILEDQAKYDRLAVEGWYNRTRFEGDNLSAGKRRTIPFVRLTPSMTDVDAMSTGYRIALGWEDTGFGALTAGTDLRYLKQRLNELNRIDLGVIQIENKSAIPRSHSSNPGIFVETVGEPVEGLNLQAGARVDWTSTNADNDPSVVTTPLPTLSQVLLGELNQHFRLWSVYLQGDYALDETWRLELAGGHAMRPPTLTELYAANAPFIAALPQTRGTSVIGDPNLDAERMWQIDVGIDGERGRWSTGLHGFYAWINDYITFDLLDDDPPVVYAFTNTDLATLAGFDFVLDYQLSSCVDLFGTLTYVEGRDRSRAGNPSTVRQAGRGPNASASRTLRSDSTSSREPLPVMPPLQSRLGFTLHEATPEPRWSVEFSTRLADQQDRVATTLFELETEGYAVFDIRGYARVYDELTLTAGVLNVTNENYRTYFDARRTVQEGDSIPVFQPGVSFYFGSELMY